MNKTIIMVLGSYAAIAFVVFLYQMVFKIEDGFGSGDAFTAAVGTGVLWPVSLVATFWR